jgi:hypothetical protein
MYVGMLLSLLLIFMDFRVSAAVLYGHNISIHREIIKQNFKQAAAFHTVDNSKSL